MVLFLCVNPVLFVVLSPEAHRAKSCPTLSAEERG